MAHVHHSHSYSRFSVPFFGLAQNIVRRYRDRRQMNALLKMDDFMLKDIGVSRSDIQNGATRPLWRD